MPGKRHISALQRKQLLPAEAYTVILSKLLLCLYATTCEHVKYRHPHLNESLQAPFIVSKEKKVV